MEKYKKPKIHKGSVSPWEKLISDEQKYHDYEFPKVSIIIPTFECAQSISLTLDSVLEQEYPDYEVLIVDAGSTDRTLEVVKGYRNEKIRLFSVSSYQRYEMVNKGLTHASGYYINVLFPGDFYLFHNTLKVMMILALDAHKPLLVYCGTLLRDGKSEAKILYRELTLKLLKNGQQPSSLQSCWFRIDLFSEIGKFDTTYELRGGYEFLCRLYLAKKNGFASTSRVLTDYDLRLVTWRMVSKHFGETFITINKYFGLAAVIKWLFRQKDGFRFMRLWWRSMRVAFLGR